ncbi:hypothetical protein TREVI0001_0373 [Treponema vincentii ATCC 35580]|uniref:Uncharacterized protein n=1 Tax=Treponema vincentii ATCC 35580 TaxID=596324 RepID=C8PTF6_9SPIR|nr:hypothetical protein TREVI0001_0373 [Treponema vincentii ATCC 35580]
MHNIDCPQPSFSVYYVLLEERADDGTNYGIKVTSPETLPLLNIPACTPLS